MTLFNRANLLLSAMLVCVPLNLSALESDRQQPVDVAADAFEHNDRTGVTTLTGNVQLIQGTLHINGDRAIVYRVDGVLVRVEVFGAPATLEQEMDNDEGQFKSRANYMDYVLTSQLLALKQSVVVNQGQRQVTGDAIDYDLAKGQVTGSGESRVRMSFPAPESSDSDSDQ